MLKTLSQERKAELLIMTEVAIFAFFPIFANHATKLMPPILFAGITMLVAAFFLFLYILFKKELADCKNTKALAYILGVTVFIVILPSILIYTGTSKTSTVNTAILLQMEILFTFLIVGIFTHEKITAVKILGGFLILLGAISVLYNGVFRINWGDILIIAGTAFYPIGNMYAKKALHLVPPSVVLFLRSILGGGALLLISFAFEHYNVSFLHYFRENLTFLLLNGLLIYCITKLIWYEGLKRIDISKAVPLGMTHPAFSLLYAYIFFHEIPTAYQWLGFLIIFLGIFVITRKREQVALPITD